MIEQHPHQLARQTAGLRLSSGMLRLMAKSVLVALVGCFAGGGAASAKPAQAQMKVADHAADAVSQFYRSRADEPLWFGETSGNAAQQLLRLLGTAEVDGVNKDKFQLGSLLLAVRRASNGDATAIKEAEFMLSEAFVAYARDLQRDPKVGVIYVDPELKPTPSSAAALLEDAAKAASLEAHIRELRWMNPLYGQLRQALVASPNLTDRDRHVLMLNLARARAFPPATDRYVLVNTANQRLYMYENGTVVDEMKVVAGRPNAQTPLMNAYVRFAVLNPYWNVPADITARLAPNVIKRGSSYLDQQGYQVVSDFGDNPSIIDPASVDWNSVAAGDLPVKLRQLPGPANSMGRVKFMFPNSQGVWLHDTPTRGLFENVVRLESAGCIRLEDAWRFGSWLFQRPLKSAAREVEKELQLPEPVPVYITYLTAIPQASSVTFIHDGYRRDPPPVDEVRYTQGGVGLTR
jgi:L,D-transpeptidase YcbB